MIRQLRILFLVLIFPTFTMAQDFFHPFNERIKYYFDLIDEINELMSVENPSQNCHDVFLAQIQIDYLSNEITLNIADQYQENKEIKSFDLSLLQSFLTLRIKHLRKLDQIIQSPSSVCVYPTESTARFFARMLKTQSMLSMADSLFTKKGIRNVIQKMYLYRPYELKDLKIIYQSVLNDQNLEQLKNDYEFLFSKKSLTSQEEYILFQTPLAKKIIQHDEGFSVKRKFYTLGDRFFHSANGALAAISKGYGFVASKIKWRSGNFKNNKYLINFLKTRLEPLDILFEKRESVFTDYTIPGFWGHTAIYLGTKDQLLEMGLWEEDFLKPFRDQIEMGKVIFEARKEGLTFKSIEEFTDLDQIGAIRFNDKDTFDKRDFSFIYENLKRQIGKEYDYNFNALSINKITCTEIIVQSYGDVHWPYQRAISQLTVAPDNLAEIVMYKNAPFHFVFYFEADSKSKYFQRTMIDWAKRLDFYIRDNVFQYKSKKCHHELSGKNSVFKCENVWEQKEYFNEI